MSWIWLLVVFLLGLFVGYLLCDLMTTENKIAYHIKRLKLKDSPEGSINIDAHATQDRKTKRQLRRESRKNKKNGT